MLKFIFIQIVFLPFLTIHAQQVANVRVTQEGDKVVINYDITSDQAGQTFDIKVECSADDGKNFSLIPQSLTGDLKGIKAGAGKRIVWDVLSEMHELAGDQFVFQLMASDSYSGNSGSFIDDRDGHVYKWVRIGTQIWMVENLKATKYRNGKPIPYVTDNKQWSNLTIGAYCNYENIINNSDIYGRLYNCYALSDSFNIAPIGWHLPTDEEWTMVTNSLGGSEVAGTIMKNTSGWKNGNGNNKSGFAAIPGGCRESDGKFYDVGIGGYWWRLSKGSSNNACYRAMGYDHNSVLSNGKMSKIVGLSVRCVKD